MKTQFCIDWLSFTQDLTVLPVPSQFCINAKHGDWYNDTAHNGYKQAFRNANGASVQWNEDRPDMRVLTQYSGKALERYISEGTSSYTVARHHAQMGYRATRIDLAIDVHDSGMDITKMYRQLKNGKATSGSTKINLIEGIDGGCTLYIGSRQSERMIRIYDKAAEQSIPGDWKRIEIELKGEVARGLGTRLATLTENQLGSVAKGILQSMVCFPGELWQHIIADNAPFGLTVSHKQSDNLKGWLADQVAPAIARYLLQGGDHDILDQLAYLVDYHMARASRL